MTHTHSAPPPDASPYQCGTREPDKVAYTHTHPSMRIRTLWGLQNPGDKCRQLLLAHGQPRRASPSKAALKLPCKYLPLWSFGVLGK